MNDPETEKKAASFAMVLQSTKADVLTRRVTDQASYDWAGQIVVKMNATKDALIEERKKATGPLRQSINVVNSWFKPAEDAIDAAVSHLKKEIGTYVRSVNETRAERAIAGQAVELAPPATPGIQVRTVEDWEIVDADKVPREYCSPDVDKIRAYLRDGGLRAMPGVRFFRREQVISARTVKP